MATFFFILMLITAAMLSTFHLGLTIPPLVAAYLIARFTDFKKVSDRECFGILVALLIAAAIFFTIKSYF